MTSAPRYFLHCRKCDDTRAHVIHPPRHRVHAFLTVLTLGMWIPGWVAATVRARKPRCRACGTRRGMSRTAVRQILTTRPKRRISGARHLNDAA